MFIDTHAHLNFAIYDNDREKIVKQSLENGIQVVNIGSNYESSVQAIALAEKYKSGIYATIGLHPINILNSRSGNQKSQFQNELPENIFEEFFAYKKYKKLAQSQKVVAIGEIGLDYYYKPKTKKRFEEFKEKQKIILLEQLKLAKELNLATVFHCRMAHNDFIEILNSRFSETKTELRGVIHCFTGNWEQAQKYLSLGLYLGFNGLIFKLDFDTIIKKMPLERIVLETDCPYLTPLPAVAFLPAKDLSSVGAEAVAIPSTRNEPIFIKYIAEKIAFIKGISLERAAIVTTRNARKLFKIQ